MYQICKVLNNNGIVARDIETGQECIFLGKGIGFSKKADETFQTIADAKCYVLKKDGKLEDKNNIVNNVDPCYLDIANEIILLAEKKFGAIDNHILLPLADHIAFSIEREKNHLVISNPLHVDIKILFPEEYEIAEHSKSIIYRYTNKEISEEEVGYIAMHIHSALTNDHVSKSAGFLHIIESFMKQLEESCDFTMEKESLSYTRLLTHIKYMILRVLKKETLHVDITPYVKSEFDKSYEVSKSLCKSLGHELGCEISETEVSYLAIHIERVCKSEEN